MVVRPFAAGRTSAVVGWTLGATCFAYLLALPPTLNGADESFTLYGAKRVWQGQAVYRDFFDFIAPGSFYLYAVAYAVGDVSITTARVTTALVNALSVTGTYFLTLYVASIGEAILAGCLVVVICVPVWNVASHNWLATALGLVAAAVLLAPSWQRSSRARPAAVGALAGMLMCSHQGRGAWLVPWLLVAVPLLGIGRRGHARGRQVVREFGWMAAGGAAVCTTVLGYAVWRASLAELLYATHTWVLSNYKSYNVGRVGWRWASHGWILADSLKYTSLWLMQATPALLAAEAIGVLWAIWRRGLFAELIRLLVLLLALSAVGAITYFPDVAHIALVLPYVLVVLGGMLFRVRRWLVSGATPAARTLAGALWAAAFALVLLKARTNLRLAWEGNPVLYETAFGTLAGSDMRAQTHRELRAKLLGVGAGSPRLFAYPTDAWLYLVLPADNPTPFALLLPVYNTPGQFQAAIDHLEQAPDPVVLVNDLLVKAGDPFVAYLERARWREVANGLFFRLYAREPTG